MEEAKLFKKKIIQCVICGFMADFVKVFFNKKVGFCSQEHYERFKLQEFPRR